MIRILLSTVVLALTAINAAPVANADPMGDLMGMLPAGYGPDSCQPGEVLAGMLARVQCGPNSLPGGPFDASYALFSNPDAMEQGFANIYNSYSVWTPCPGGQSKLPAHYPGGSFACSPHILMWSRYGDLLLGVAKGELADLFDWVAASGAVR